MKTKTDIDSAFIERLKKCVELAGSESALAKAAQISTSGLRRYLSGGDPTRSKLNAIAQAVGVSLEWLATGKGPMHPSDPDITDKNEFAFVNMVNVELSAGGGTFIQDERLREHYAFRRDWLNKICLVPSKAVLMRVKGDSMHPTISDGDTVMIDQSRTRIIPGNIYALRMDETVMLKRLEPMPGGKVRIISDNPIYKEYEAPISEIHILGQVVWVAKELEKPEI